jgi:hypothetical protein
MGRTIAWNLGTYFQDASRHAHYQQPSQDKYDPLAFPTRAATIRFTSSETSGLHRLLFALARGSNL